jgi:prepilin-type N-terminal cleavage/methylation domain-containing protein
MPKFSKGFTIIELSIAIIIISVLLSISIVSRNIIENHELKKIYSNLAEYENSIKAFNQIYENIPGDMIKGYDLFADENCKNSINNKLNIKGCNGDDNKKINFIDQQDQAVRETILAWYHLYKADLISFNNNNQMRNSQSKCANNIAIAETGYNIPALNFRDLGIYIEKKDAKKNVFSLILKRTESCNFKNNFSAFRLKELKELDLKFDNGLERSGNITYQCRKEVRNCGFSYNFAVDSELYIN